MIWSDHAEVLAILLCVPRAVFLAERYSCNRDEEDAGFVEVCISSFQ